MTTDKKCNDCGVTFNPSSEGIVGGAMAFCTDCCRKDSTEYTDCGACGEKVPHVDTANGWCDACHDEYNRDYALIDEMDDMIANGASHMES